MMGDLYSVVIYHLLQLDGANGDFYLDTNTKNLYGPKIAGSYQQQLFLFQQILSGVVAPLSNQGKLNDYFFNSVTKELYGPKTVGGWGAPTLIGEADYSNVLYVKPNGNDIKDGKTPSKAFQTIRAAARLLLRSTATLLFEFLLALITKRIQFICRKALL